jgi:hypothetical protein
VFRRLNENAERADDVFSDASDAASSVTARLAARAEAESVVVDPDFASKDVAIFVKARVAEGNPVAEAVDPAAAQPDIASEQPGAELPAGAE